MTLGELFAVSDFEKLVLEEKARLLIKEGMATVDHTKRYIACGYYDKKCYVEGFQVVNIEHGSGKYCKIYIQGIY